MININKFQSTFEWTIYLIASCHATYISLQHLDVFQDLAEFMDNSKKGVIFFSLGSIIRAASLPNETIKAFVDTFAELEQNVLWKFEDESIEVSSNVLVRKWFPQRDILGSSIENATVIPYIPRIDSVLLPLMVNIHSSSSKSEISHTSWRPNGHVRSDRHRRANSRNANLLRPAKKHHELDIQRKRSSSGHRQNYQRLLPQQYPSNRQR